MFTLQNYLWPFRLQIRSRLRSRHYLEDFWARNLDLRVRNLPLTQKDTIYGMILIIFGVLLCITSKDAGAPRD